MKEADHFYFLRNGGLHFQGENLLSCGEGVDGEITIRQDNIHPLLLGKTFHTQLNNLNTDVSD